MTDLSDVKGINARQIKLLNDNGISNAEALAMSPSNVVAAIDGLGDKTAKKLIWNSRNALGMTEFVSASSIAENVEHITTGSSELDRILGGGVATCRLTEVYGPFKSGKTNLAQTIAVAIQLPKSKGGLNSAVAYIDTENTFSKEKIKRIARRFGLDPQSVLSSIYHARIYSSDHQMQMIMKAETLCKSKNVRLIVVDSLMALLRAEYVGIGMLARRQGVLNNMIHTLSRIAETHNCAILLTNQVATKMMGMFSGNDAIGGNIVAHGCHFRVMFKTKGFSSNNSLKRRAVIVDAPDLPPEECEFYITAAGIADTEKVEIPSEEPILEPEELGFNVEPVLEAGGNGGSHETIPIINVAGIGNGTAKTLNSNGIYTISELMDIDSKDLASKVSGISESMINKWKTSAKKLAA